MHPGQQQLRDFVLGRLSESLSDEIAEHLEQCTQCNATLTREAEEDSLILLLRGAPQPATVASTSKTLTLDDSSPSGQKPSVTLSEIQIEGYQILGELGRGGMGVVYHAMDLRLKREVALKVVLAGAHSSPTQRERFRQEAETTAKLHHPGIVQIFEVGQSEQHPYLALELVSGQTLAEYTQSEPQPIKWAATMVLQLAQTMFVAHGQSIVHRDLKPNNVLLVRPEKTGSSGSGGEWLPPLAEFGQPLTSVPVAKITDFGLAKQIDSGDQLTRTGLIVGTPAYMAPEQATGHSGQAIGPATDVYALGAMLYELLTGQAVVRSEEVLDAVMEVIEVEPPPPKRIRREVPASLDTICQKCLSKDPSDRYGNAGELADDLERFLLGEPIHARSLGITGRLARWGRHHPWLALTYLTCIGFYGLHLVARFVLELPLHNAQLRWAAPAMLLTATGLSTLVEFVFDKGRAQLTARYMLSTVWVVFITIGFQFDAGPKTAPVPAYLLAIPLAVFIHPRRLMVWYVTFMSMACYAYLWGSAYWWHPENAISVEHGIAFLLIQLIMGITMHFMVRRVYRPLGGSALGSGSHHEKHV